ncbi:MAG: hypothetical protein HY016_08830 [Nitrosomonadales bacterium]|nr:hypothetical protein [Nitrosomonadales bacterium]
MIYELPYEFPGGTILLELTDSDIAEIASTDGDYRAAVAMERNLTNLMRAQIDMERLIGEAAGDVIDYIATELYKPPA